MPKVFRELVIAPVGIKHLPEPQENQDAATKRYVDDHSGGAPVGASYLTLGTNATLTDERVITAGTNISFVDGGPGGLLTINASGGAMATDTLWDAKGDLAVATANDTAVALAVGANGYVLTADSAAATGVKWAAAGGGNAVEVTVDFGASFTHFAETVVTGQAWVTGTSVIVATPRAAAGEVEETVLFQFSPTVSARSAGVGFTLSVYAPIEAKGTYTFACVGV